MQVHTTQSNQYKNEDESKYLHNKKQKLTTLIYHLHLILANTWIALGNTSTAQLKIKLQKEIWSKYQNLDKKFNQLTKSQTTTPQQKHNFLP